MDDNKNIVEQDHCRRIQHYNLISENEESTVVAEFEQGGFAAEAPYMSEHNLDKLLTFE